MLHREQEQIAAAGKLMHAHGADSLLLADELLYNGFDLQKLRRVIVAKSNFQFLMHLINTVMIMSGLQPASKAVSLRGFLALL